MMKHFEVISRYCQEESYQQIARELRIDRKTVNVICSKYNEGLLDLEASTNEKDVEKATEALVFNGFYDRSNRKNRAYTKEVMARMKGLYQEKLTKNQRLGTHKQVLTAMVIHEILMEESYSMGYRTVAH